MGLAATWLTREEGILALVPLVVLFLPLALRVVMRNGRDGLVRDLARCVGVTGAAFGTGVGAVMLLNLSHYGVFTLNDQTSRPFTTAVGALLSVKHFDPVAFRPIPREVRLRAYRESPAFASIAPFLDGSQGSAEQRRQWMELSCFLDDTTCGDFGGAWVVWAVRQAAADAGHYRSAATAAAFFDRMASELGAACDGGRLRCGTRRSSFVPPLLGTSVRDLFEYGWLGTQEVLRFRLRDYVLGSPSESECNADEVRRMEWLTGGPVRHPRCRRRSGPGRCARPMRASGSPAGSRPATGPGSAPWSSWHSSHSSPSSPRRGGPGRASLLVLALALVAAIASRIAMLAYVEATMFPAFGNWPAYITPLYPLLLLLSGMTLASFGSTAAAAIRQRVTPVPPAGR